MYKVDARALFRDPPGTMRKTISVLIKPARLETFFNHNMAFLLTPDAKTTGFYK